MNDDAENFVRAVCRCQLTTSEKMVLVSLFARRFAVMGDGPKYEEIARDCGLNPRTLCRIIKRLETDGYVRVERNGRGSNYWLSYERIGAIIRPAEPQSLFPPETDSENLN